MLAEVTCFDTSAGWILGAKAPRWLSSIFDVHFVHRIKPPTSWNAARCQAPKSDLSSTTRLLSTPLTGLPQAERWHVSSRHVFLLMTEHDKNMIVMRSFLHGVIFPVIDCDWPNSKYLRCVTLEYIRGWPQRQRIQCYGIFKYNERVPNCKQMIDGPLPRIFVIHLEYT